MKARAERFAIASNQGTIGGGEVMLFTIAEAARELGREVTVVAPASPGEVVEEARRRGFRTVAIDSPTTVDYLRNLRRWDQRKRRGLLWCNGLRPALATAGHPDRVVELHHQPRRRFRPLVRIATRGALRVVVPSESMLEAYPEATVVWNWNEKVDVPLRTPGPVIRLGYLGRLAPGKGVHILCRAVEELERRSPGRFTLTLAGDTRWVSAHDIATVDAAVDRLGPLAHRTGWIAREDFFAAIDLAVFPSIWQESFGLVVSEAMSARVPFVVSDTGALLEIAGDTWRASPGDPIDLADAIERAVAAPKRYVAAGYERWQEHFSAEVGRTRLATLLAELASPGTETLNIALAHDYLTQRGGAERVALTLAQQYPGAELTTTVYAPHATYPEFGDVRVRCTWLNRLEFLHRNFRLGLPLYGLAFSTTRIDRQADVVVSSTTGYAHGIAHWRRTRARRVVYCHSPPRFLYLVDDYLGMPWWRTPVGWALMALRPALITWDQAAARRADVYLTNSTHVRTRIRDAYGIDATVVHPPFTLDPEGAQEPIAHAPQGRFHVLISRLMPYKNVDVAIEAFRGMPGRQLLIVGAGPLRDRLRTDLPPNVTMVEGISDAQLRWAYANAVAVIAPSREDFGLTPVEGFAFGTPALTLRAGGYLDSVVEGVTGWFFDSATPAAIEGAVAHLDEHPLDATTIRRYARQFSPESFAEAINREIHRAVELGH